MPVVARAAAHYWEEPCLSGARGSGAVFFSGCSLGCVFCQNEPISHHTMGQAMNAIQLCALFERVEALGVHNLNLVNPTHFAPAILEALRMRKPGIPVVWNSSGYETVEMVRAASGLVDVFLPDFKYADEKTAAQLAGAAGYFQAVSYTHLDVYKRQSFRGPAVCGSSRRAPGHAGAYSFSYWDRSC